MTSHQASCVALGGGALLIEGPPGSGKTSLALALIDRGAVLIGDDGVLIEARRGQLIASPHPATLGLIEVRNLGLLPYPTAPPSPIGLVLRLDPNAPRYVEDAGRVELLGMALPMIQLTPHEPVLALKAELAWSRFALLPL
jgi:serine kinase of HPr protein (carbohydrate metabolism regulator)